MTGNMRGPTMRMKGVKKMGTEEKEKRKKKRASYISISMNRNMVIAKTQRTNPNVIASGNIMQK